MDAELIQCKDPAKTLPLYTLYCFPYAAPRTYTHGAGTRSYSDEKSPTLQRSSLYPCLNLSSQSVISHTRELLLPILSAIVVRREYVFVANRDKRE